MVLHNVVLLWRVLALLCKSCGVTGTTVLFVITRATSSSGSGTLRAGPFGSKPMHNATRLQYFSIIRKKERLKRMRRLTAPSLLLLLFITTTSSLSSPMHVVHSDKRQSSDAFSQTPSLQSILAQPKSAAVLLDAAVDKVIRAHVFSNWTLSALRHVSRENEGLPHVVEVRHDCWPSTPPQLASQPRRVQTTTALLPYGLPVSIIRITCTRGQSCSGRANRRSRGTWG